MSPLVTVVIPTRNRAGMLLQALRSVLAQRVDLEVVVVDEGSTDDTAQRLTALADPRVRTIRHDVPCGLARARNAGLEVARGDVVAFLDDDDLWLPAKLAAQVAAMEATRRAWALGGALTFSAGPVLHAVRRPAAAADIVACLPYRNAVPGGGSNVVALRTALEALGGFDAAPRTVEDWDLWIRLSRLGPPAVIDAPVVAYRRHPGNMSRRIPDVLHGARVIDARYRADRGGAPLDWSDLYRWLAAAALAEGDRRAAIRLHAAGLRRRHPGSARRLVRCLIPLAPRAAVVPGAGAQRHWLDRWRPRGVVGWPDGVEAELRSLLDDVSG